ncbi:MAG: FAD-dependent oxidoreductase, partial [Brumimicrobium sp.]|nr:FAD-dependent oxidoreductase [Brumimicrobium sp.]
MKIAVIGAGIGGLGAAVRFANLGHEVTVFEANDHVGGKINNLQLGEYRWDMGPSVFTGPEYVKELYELCGEDFNSFRYSKLKNSFNYFFPDGTHFSLPANKEELLDVFENELGENRKTVEKYLEKANKNYKSIAPVFIETTLHRWRHLLNRNLLKALWGLPRYKLNKTMNGENASLFRNPKTVQIFNRYATYNGSSPFKAPAMLNMIQHLEMNVGVFLPEKGMVQIPRSIYQLAVSQGAKFRFNEKVSEIIVENKSVKGLITEKSSYTFDAVISNMDVKYTYEKLLGKYSLPSKKSLAQEKS